MPEQLLDAAQVRTGAEKLCRENVAERVRSDALALGDARCIRVAAKRGREDRGGEAVAETSGRASRFSASA
jgi:hypothetical protein